MSSNKAKAVGVRASALWTMAQAAAAWGVSYRTVSGWIARGHVLAAMRVGDVWVIPAGLPRPKVPGPGRPRKGAR